MIFDLDGTLVQSERLKALAYGKAVGKLLGTAVQQEVVTDLYKQVVGQTRDTVSRFLMERLDLEEACLALLKDHGVQQPWQVLTALRVAVYEEMIADPGVLRAHQWPHNVGLLRLAKASGCGTALATSSYTAEARHVLQVLELADLVDVVVGLDQVQRPKPDPEVYLTAATKLGVPPEECLAIEDSPPGMQAALAAGMYAVAVATDFTRGGLHAAAAIHQWVVHDPEELLEVVGRRIREHNRAVHHQE